MRIQIELWVLDALLQMMRLGRSVPPFQLPFVGDTKDERAAHLARAKDWLAEYGMLDSYGEIRDEVEDAILTWYWPDVLLTSDLWDLTDGSYSIARGGWTRKHGVFAYQDGETLVLLLMKPEDVLNEFQLPPAEAFYGKRAVTIVDDPNRNADDDAGDGFASMRDNRQRRGIRRQDGNVDVFFQYGFARMGIITAGTVRKRGEPAQRSETFTWCDTPNGRFAIMNSPVGDGAVRRVFEPTDGNSLLRWWITDRTD